MGGDAVYAQASDLFFDTEELTGDQATRIWKNTAPGSCKTKIVKAEEYSWRIKNAQCMTASKTAPDQQFRAARCQGYRQNLSRSLLIKENLPSKLVLLFHFIC